MLRVAISGKSGCGNTTVSGLLAQKLGIPMINYTFRTLAKEKGMTLEDIIREAKSDYRYDRKVDSTQVELAMKGSCVLGSRLAIWLLKEADLKVYLYASDDTRAHRVLEREGGNLEEIKAFTAMRDSEDTMRYRKLYKINNEDYSFADMVIQTDRLRPEDIAQLVVKELECRHLLDKR